MYDPAIIQESHEKRSDVKMHGLKNRTTKCAIITLTAMLSLGNLLSLPVLNLPEIKARADTTTSQYVQDATNTNASNKSKLDAAINNAKETSASITQDSTQTLDVNASNYNTQKNNANTDINNQVSAINKAVADYKAKAKAYQDTLSGSKISRGSIIQALRLENEPDAKIKVLNHTGNAQVSNNSNTENVVVKFPANHAEDGSVTVEYSNLSNSSYNNNKISKIVETYSQGTNSNTVSSNPSLYISPNPFRGFWYGQMKSINVNYKYYDQDNNLINLQTNQNGAGAWITFGSLNSGWGRTEGAKLNSAGKAYEFDDSSVKVHPGNWLYADTVNESIGNVNQNKGDASASGRTDNPFTSNLPYNWDTGLDSPYAYIGAGVINAFGINLNVTYTTDRLKTVGNNDTWALMSTNIVNDNSGIEPPTIKYHYTNLNCGLKVTTNYLQNNDSSKQENGSKLDHSIITNGHQNDSYSTSKKDFPGWHLTATPSNASGTLNNDDVTVNYTYDRDPESIKVRYVDEATGNDIGNPTTLNGYYGLSYSSSPKYFNGWTLSKTPSNTSGKYSMSNPDIIYQYKRNPETITANYRANNDSSKNEFGQILADSITQKGLFGKNYTTSAKDILGWHLFGIPTNQNGTYQESNPDVNYIYDRDPEIVKVKYIDTKGNTLAKSNTLFGYYGLDYHTYPASIDNYHLTSMPVNANGKYSNGPINVTYVYDVDPDIKEGLSNDAVNSKNYNDAVSNTSQNEQYNKVHHYVDKIVVGGSMKVDKLQIQTDLTSDVNPIINGGNINNQNIKIYTREDDGSLKDVTNQGSLSYQINNKDVTSDNNKNVAIDTDKTRTLKWTPKTPSHFVGKEIITDIPINIQPDAAKLKNYKANDGINIKHHTQLIESNDLPSSGEVRTDTTSQKTYNSNNTNISLPNIYTLKFYKSAFETNSTINGKIWLKLYPNLIGKEDAGNKNLATLTVDGKTQNIQNSLSTSNKEILTNVNTSKTANNSDPTFDINLKSNQTNNSQNPLILTKSLIKDQNNKNSISKTTYVSKDDLYNTTNKTAQYNKGNISSTVASAPEEVETYYNQNLTNPQTETNDEATPTYVKLMEYMNANYNKTANAKAGYGIKNDLILNYYGRHLTNASTSDSDFEKNNLATTFSTDTDLTNVNKKTSSQINDNQHELLDYTANVESANDLIKNIKNLSTDKQKTNYMHSKLGTNAGNSFVYNLAGKENTLDQADSNINKQTAYVNLDHNTKTFINTVDNDTKSTPSAPKLYSMNYRFNKRLLSYENSDSNGNGIEYYDRNSAHVSQNDDQLMNKTDPINNTTDGGYKFYTNQWLKLGKYPTHYTSSQFGTNNFKLKANRDLNIYARRYLTRSDNKNDGNKYDDLSIQPVISKNHNETGTTMPNGQWSNK